MIKRITFSLLIAAIIAAFSFPVFAQQAFYSEKFDNWIILGVPSNNGKNAVCGAELALKDGSTFAIFSDLIDGELYFSVTNTRWNIGDPVNSKATLKLNFHGSNDIKSGTADYLLMSKNVIIVPHLNAQKFLHDFMDRTSMELVMPGSIEDITIPLDGSTRATEHLVRCVQGAGKQAPPKAEKKKGIDA